MEQAGEIVLHQVDGAGGQQRSEGGRGHVVFHYPYGVRGSREAEHQFDEVAAGGRQSTGSEDAGSADHEGTVEISLRVEFAGELGNCVGAEGVRQILLDIGMPGGAIEHVIGGEVDQLGVDLPARESQVAHRQRVHQKGGLRLLFGDVHLVIRRGVEDHLRVIVCKGVLNCGRVGNIDLGAIPGHDTEPPILEFADQLDAKLSGGPENYRASTHRNTTIPNGQRFRRLAGAKSKVWRVERRDATQKRFDALLYTAGDVRCGDCFIATLCGDIRRNGRQSFC